MAEIDTADIDIDELLSTALKRVAEPGDPTGVADAIRSRMDAGDTGTPVDGPLLPRSSGWMPWVGTGLAVAILGGAVGASGLFGAGLFASPATASTSAAIAAGQSVSGGLCPGDTGAATFGGGERVLAVKRSDDSGWVAVRHPASTAGLVWLPTAVVVVDHGQAAIDSLPVGGCLIPVVSAGEENPAPAPAPEPAPQPEPGPGPAPAPVPLPEPPAGDSQAPAIIQAWATPTSVYSTESTTIHVTASDNVAVSAVNATWTGPDSGSAALTKVGSEWRLVYTFPASAPSGTVTFTLTARDAAGNASPSQTVPVTGIFFG
ncbi:Ig-like domain-containing protein [Homoserinimonas sp. A520]